jgi:hypothetical protein|tara:strand:+ start:170 stop:394 length:225 start_codon:yes stop_codon:yes gene_type:complete
MFKKLFKKIMADLKSIRKKAEVKKGISKQEISLSSSEVEFLLNLIANSKFEGKDVQIVYETAVKLQTLLKSEES